MRLELLHLEQELIAESALSKTAAAVAVALAFWGGGKLIHKMLYEKGLSPQEVEHHLKDPEVHREAQRMREQIQAREAVRAGAQEAGREEHVEQPLTQEEEYMARILFAEAANQSRAGKEAVAQVIMNRVASRARRYPDTIVGVVTARNAFEAYPNSPLWLDSANPEELDPIARRAYDECVEIARAASAGELPNRVGDAILYHDTSIDKPWGPAAVRVTQIGDLIFYREVIIR